MKKMLIIIPIVLLGITVFALNNESKKEKDIVEQMQEGASSAREAVKYFAENTNTSYGATIDSEKVSVLIEQEEYEMELESDEFYLAVAPYITNTHPCTIHNLVTCQGELVNEELDVEIIADNGEVIFDENIKTLSNGFVELWLPKNIEGTLTIKYDGKEASEKISTYEGDNTCLTTMKLGDINEKNL